MKKKILAFILAALLCAPTLAACDDTESESGRHHIRSEKNETASDTYPSDESREEEKTVAFDTVGIEKESKDSETDKESEIETELVTESETESRVDPTDIFDTFYGVDYFESNVDIANTKKVVSRDGDTEFVRYARRSELQDGFYVFSNAAKTKTQGRYLIMKYRTDHMSMGEIWANTKEASHANGTAKYLQAYRTDGNWHIMIVDLEAAIPSFVSSGNSYMLKFFRIDFLNTRASSGYMDIAYVALCNKLSDANEYISDEEQSICDHFFVSGKSSCEVCGYAADFSKGSVGLSYTVIDGGTCFVSGMGSCTDRDVVIPAKSPSGQKVIRIGGGAFKGQSGIRSVTIPKTVTMITSGAFQDCTSLESIDIPDSVTFIGCEAFRGCTALKKIVIPDSVTEIQNGIFYECTSLNSISVPIIGDPCEDYDGQLVDFFGFEEDIPRSLSSVTVTNCKNIPDKAFRDFKYLTSITFAEGTETIGEHAFAYCKSLYTVSIPESIVKISPNAFSGCPNLKYNEYEGGKYLGNSVNPYVAIMDGRDASVIHPSAKYIGFEAFRTTYVKEIVIPEGVRYIESFAFDDGQYLSRVTLPNSLISIGDSAFNGCSELKEVVFGDAPKLKNIGHEAFRYCTSLEEFTLPERVEFIAPYAFQACSSLKNVYFEMPYGWWTSPYEVGAPYFDQSLAKDVDSDMLANDPQAVAEKLVASSAYWYRRK